MQINNNKIEKKKEDIELGEMLSNSNFTTPFKEFDLEHIKKMLKYKTMRSVVDWCGRKKLFINRQGLSKSVNMIDFILCYYGGYISSLKKEYKNWRERLEARVNDDLNLALSLNDEESIPYKNERYKSNTIKGRAFLDQLKNIKKNEITDN